MNSLRILFALNRKLPWQYAYQSQMFQARHIYSASSLGLDVFANVTDKVKVYVKDQEEFKIKIKSLCDPATNSLVLVEDIKKMVAVSETDEDLKVLHELLLRYFKQQEAVAFTTYKISPIIMRALHILNKPKQAIEIVEDPVCNPHFHIFTTVLVFLDLLLKNNMYTEVLKFYNLFENTFPNLPNQLTLILLAACYKLNTEESFTKAKAIFKLESEIRPAFRKTLFVAALAIKQDDPFCALEVLHYIKKLNSLPAALKLMALVKGGRYIDALSLCQDLVQKNAETRFFIPSDVVSVLEKEFQNAPQEYRSTFDELLKKFEGSIISETLDKFLFAEVQLSQSNNANQTEFLKKTASSRRF